MEVILAIKTIIDERRNSRFLGNVLMFSRRFAGGNNDVCQFWCEGKGH